MSRQTGEAWLGSKQKRNMDRVLALGLLPVAEPLVWGAAGLIGLVGGGRPFITQKRLGQYGEPLLVTKLRTMKIGTEETMSSGYNDSRRTRIGLPLSMLHLDEAPQLWSVLRGEMSMVGLRPLVRSHYEEFMDSLDAATRAEVTRAYNIAPTGWLDPYGVDLHVHGIPDTPEARAKSIVNYVQEASFHKDVQIMFQSLGVMKHMVGTGAPELMPVEAPAQLLVEDRLELE